MKTFWIKDKDSGTKILVSGMHIGWDTQRRTINRHALCCADSEFVVLSDGGPLKVLEKLDKKHKLCFKTPFKPLIRKDLYEFVI